MELDENLESLEWPLLLRQYSAHCQSAPAKLAASSLLPAESRPEAERLIELTSEARTARESASFAFLSSLDELEGVLERLRKSAVMAGKELFSLARLAEVSTQLRVNLSGKEVRAHCPLLLLEADRIPELSSLAAPIRHAIEPDGSVKDSASPTLRSLRDQERKLHGEAREKLDAILQKAFRDGHLQDKFFDFRDGRYLIPVKSEHKNRVPGFVVESSATRATVFLEPAAVRDCNDRIKQLQLQIEEEIYRILEELSRKLHPHGEEFQQAYESAVMLDLTFARASFAAEYDSIRGSSRPEFADQFSLEDLYHPLLGFVLKPEEIVRNSFHLGPEIRVLVISGPNTGGKTVLLKAVGLSALMARAGFYIPCAGHAKVPFFSGVLSQIGDAQDLELSLSSFSGSILHLKAILESAQKNSLVLVDEILHATDPDEATALSRAILEALQERGSFAVVTTHLNGLKVGTSFESASMEFDPERLSPTYRLRMGVPGSSRALEIAQKLGLDGGLVGKARSYLSEERVREQKAVDQLEARERELLAVKEELERAKDSLSEEHSRLKELNTGLEDLKRRFRAEALEKLKDQQRSALQEVEQVVSAYKKKLHTVEEKHGAALAAQADTELVKEKFKEAERVVEELSPPTKAQPEQEEEPEGIPVFQKNAPVKIPAMKTEGVLLSDPEDKKRPAEVLIGNIRMRMSWDQLEPRAPAKPKAGSRPYATSSDHAEAPAELHLLGKTVDEAEALLASYLDRAARSGRPWVRIVHGHGSGALKKIVRETLKRSPYEVKFRPGSPSEGGEGCTVVEFV